MLPYIVGFFFHILSKLDNNKMKFLFFLLLTRLYLMISVKLIYLSTSRLLFNRCFHLTTCRWEDVCV